MSDSLIRVRQVNKPEFSGYTVEIIKQYLTTGSVTISGSGILTGSFYPLNSNPSGYLTGQVVRPSNTGNLVDTTALALQTNSILSQVSGLYYPKSNPSGYLTKTSGDSIYVSLGPTVNTGQLIFDDSVDAGYAIYFIPNKFFALRGTGNSVIDLYNNSGAYISGFAVKSNDIQLNGKTVLNDETKFAHVTKTDAVTYNQSLYLYDAIKTAFPFAFNDGSEFFMSGINGAIIDLYDSTRSTTSPYISGFDIYSTGIWLNGVPITGLNTTGVTQAQLLATSGALDADIQDVRSDLSGVADRVGEPTGVPTVVYLNKVPQNYTAKGLTSFATPQEVFNYMVSGGSGLYKVVVGTGTFPEGILSGTTGNNPANLYKFGELVLVNEYNSNVYSPLLDIQFRNCSGRVRLDNSVYAGFQCTTGVLAFDCNEKFPRDVNSGPLFIFSDVTGAINNFRIDTFFIGGPRTNARIDNCYVDAMFITSPVPSGIAVTNSELPFVGAWKAPSTSGWQDRYTATNSTIGKTLLAPASTNGIQLSFSGAKITSDAPNYILPSGWGALAYAKSGLFLVKNDTGFMNSPDQIITRTTGDSLYYSVSNPSNYATQSYVSTNYATQASAAYIGDTGHNTSFYLWHSGVDVLAFNSAQNLFRLSPRTGSAYIDVVNGIISGFKVDASSLLISGSGVGNNTGTFASIDDYAHNSRFGLVSTGSNVTGFYFGGGNNPYYLQGVFRFENGALQYNNLIDLQNSSISGFSIYSCPVIWANTVNTANLTVTGPASFPFGGVTISGNTPITNADTGNFLTTGATGTLLVGKDVTGIYSGSFYPLRGNPSGFLTGNTGGFVDRTTTGIYSGTFYPLNSNPSGYLTGSTGGFVTTAQTGTLLVGKNQTGVFTDSFVDRIEADQVIIPGLSFGAAEGDQIGIWGGGLSNALANWTRRGNTINTYTVGSIVSITSPENTVEVVFANPQVSRGFSSVTRTGAGTAVWEFSGSAFTVPSHASWQPYFVVRTTPSLISGVGVELLNNSNVWENVFSGAPSFSGMLWAGPYTGMTGFPIRGARFSLQYITGTTGTSYINEFGVWNKNYIKGSNLYAFQYDAANFSNTNISGVLTATGVVVSGVSVVTKNQTGILVGTNQTGILVGVNQTGTFVTTTDSRSLTFSNSVQAKILTLTGGGQVGTLQAGSSDSVYLGFYARTASPGVRSSYLGYGFSGSDLLEMANEISGGYIRFSTVTNGGIQFYPSGASKVLINTVGLGIGTTPSAALDVSGTILATNATVGGSPVITQAQTGIYSGSFYPLNTNPSGYLTAGNTGSFVVTGQSGLLRYSNLSSSSFGTVNNITGGTWYRVAQTTSGSSRFAAWVDIGCLGGPTPPTSRLFYISHDWQQHGGINLVHQTLTNTITGIRLVRETGFTAAYVEVCPNGTVSGTAFQSTVYNDDSINGYPLVAMNWSGLTGALPVNQAIVTQMDVGSDAAFAVSTSRLGSDYVRINSSGLSVTGRLVLTRADSGNFVGINQTGNFITTGQTGDYFSESQGGQVTAAISGYNLVSNRYGFGGGIYTFTKGVNSGTFADIFSIINSGGAQIMDVMVNCSTSGYSAAKSYAVAHAYGTQPISQLKISTPISGTQDFRTDFYLTGSGVSGMAMRINNNGTLSGNFMVTLILGASPSAITLIEF